MSVVFAVFVVRGLFVGPLIPLGLMCLGFLSREGGRQVVVRGRGGFSMHHPGCWCALRFR